MGSMTVEKEIEVLLPHVETAMQGDKDAIKLCFDFLKVSHFWDDLIDKDSEYLDSWTNHIFELMLVEIPRNPFYRRFFNELSPVIANEMVRWQTANVIESRKDETNYKVSYILRASWYDFVVYCASLIGGTVWGSEAGHSIWKVYGEDFEKYTQEMNNV